VCLKVAFNAATSTRKKNRLQFRDGFFCDYEPRAKPDKTFQSGPTGGDRQIGSGIVSNERDFLIFFGDSLETRPHEPDVKALLRMAVV
jgi:hypothetical protein